MSYRIMVETPTGELVGKTREALVPEDRVVFDGPHVSPSVNALKRSLVAEIKAAGGLRAWRMKVRTASGT